MSDASVRTALRSSASLVVVEAPAGCGKTHQAAEYAREIAPQIGTGRVLILTHTHAACDVFAARTHETSGRVEIRTIDSLIGQVATVYHRSLNLPPDPPAWARSHKDGYQEVASRVARLLYVSPMIGHALASRYPVVVCDEHQDASADQNEIALVCHAYGAALRVFADPMQRIFEGRKADRDASTCRWERLKSRAEAFEELDFPHRWPEAQPLGRWILAARSTLRSGGRLDLRVRAVPPGVSVLFAENTAPVKRGPYLLSKEDSGPIYSIAQGKPRLLVLSAHNRTVSALRAFFGWRLPIWEGHVRQGLDALVSSLKDCNAVPVVAAEAMVTFLNSVATGFSPSAFGDRLLTEVSTGCSSKPRPGTPTAVQALARVVIEEPSHKGVAKALYMVATDPVFRRSVRIHHRNEYRDALRLGRFDDPDEGMAELSRRRTYARLSLPPRAISTIHKAKALECSDVLVMPCDATHFGDSDAARCRLYVAMSRAMRTLTFVVSRESPSPLLTL